MNSDTVNPAPNTQELISAGRDRLVRLAWLLTAALAGGIFLTALPSYLLNYRQALHSAAGATTLHILAALFSMLAFLVSFSLSILLYRRSWEDRMVPFIAWYLLVYSVVMAGPLEYWSYYWLKESYFATNLQGLVMTTPTIVLLALFPNGRFIPSWTRGLVFLSLFWVVLMLFVPVSQLYSAPQPLVILFVLFVLSIVVPGLYAQIYRYRNVSSTTERLQTRLVIFAMFLWFAYVSFSTGPYFYLESLPPDAPRPAWAIVTSLGWWMSLNILPLALAIAVLRYRLWDVDVFINRTLLYGLLTASVVGIYVLVVGTLGLLFQNQINAWMALVATGLVAVLFQPLRDRLQRTANRIVYGQRDEPLTVLVQLGKRVETTLTPERVMPTLVETIASTLKLPYVAISLHHGTGQRIAEAYGKAVSEPVAYPLIYQGEEIGRLLVGRRGPGEEFTSAEEHLLRNIALQAGTAVHAVQLTTELQRSRQRLVSALEEERRRIRRDLHDGLGPTLAAHMLKVGSARALLEVDPDEAARLMDELEGDLQDTLHQIRQLVYNLRPPALDQLGLGGAIQDYANQISRVPEQGIAGWEVPELIVNVTVPEQMPPLPAAVEVTAYRIVQEALANVARHARARHCLVELTCDDDLRLTIRDDGIGLPADYRAGVGLTSMQERVTELGGSCLVKAVPVGGTLIQAVIPLVGDQEGAP
jgi:signal transduction histidine kinase